MTETTAPRRGGRRPGAGRPGRDVPIANLFDLPAATGAQLLALTRQRRAIAQQPRLSQTQVVCDLIAEAFAALDREYQDATEVRP